MRGWWRPNRTEIFWLPLLWPSTLCLCRSLDAQPEALGSTMLGAAFLYCISSVSSLDPNSSGPKGPSAWCGFPYYNSFISVSNSTGIATDPGARTRLRYIIVQRPLDLWNRMFDRHQAEITLMQFTGHSFPVHHSVVAQWDLHLVHIISLNPPTRSLSITGHWNVSISSGASPWNDIFGRVEGQNITLVEDQYILGLISIVYRDLCHWRSNQWPHNAEPKL